MDSTEKRLVTGGVGGDVMLGGDGAGVNNRDMDIDRVRATL